MAESVQPEAEVTISNERSLRTLSRAVTLSEGQFALILVRCNYITLQTEMRRRLHQLCGQRLRELILPKSIRTLYTTILTAIASEEEIHNVTSPHLSFRADKSTQEQVDAESFNNHQLTEYDISVDELTQIQAQDNLASQFSFAPKALMISGLESVIAIDQLLISTNQVRDEFRKNFTFPLVLWLTDDVLTSLTRFAPDFKSWAATSIKFELSTQQLLALWQQITCQLFTTILQAGIDKFLPNKDLDLAPGCRSRQELESAYKDLQIRGVNLEPNLAAIWDFILGRDAYASDEIDNALANYQQSLVMVHGQQFNQLPITGVLLFHIGLCYCRKADLQPAISRTHWEEARKYFQESVVSFEQQGRFDLVAQSISHLGEVLRRLEAWSDLYTLAQSSITQLQSYENPVRLAQSYGFLAEVARSKGNWIEACQLVQTALQLLAESSEPQPQHRGLYLLILASSQHQLGERVAAIENLELAKQEVRTSYTPQLYIDILIALRSLYFQEGFYLKAFKIKQEQRSIEQQYGFSTFLGASPLQPQRQVINSSDLRVHKYPETEALHKIGISTEITASGRQQDINRLIERISRNDNKLTVIYGASGVGKSSLLNAGLVPALRQQILGAREALPIVQRVYADWLPELERRFAEALNDFGFALEDFDWSEDIEAEQTNQLLNKLKSSNISVRSLLQNQRLIEQLQKNVNRNLLTVLIFDQFEEFFFVCTSLEERCKFYNFLRDCLNIPFVKIIISLREDYIHLLLECDRLTNLDAINNNILDKDIRYYLEDISSKEATNIIQGLTERSQFYLEPALIDAFVQDLSQERGGVRLIELQVVGAQLQAEKIKTLEQYQQLGSKPIAELVERSLQDVIKDCGQENENAVWSILFSLTNEKGVRPVKSKSDLASIGGIANRSQSILELILEILVGSGLVLRVLQESENRYQLVHDYLVQPIRQAYERRAQLNYKIQIANREQEISLVRKQNLRVIGIGISMAILAATAIVFAWRVEIERRKTAIAQTNYHLSALSASSEALFVSHKEFDALIEALRAAQLLKQAVGVEPVTKMQVLTALEQAIYGTKERNRLEGHTDVVWYVCFSPDGKTIASTSRDKTIRLWEVNGKMLTILQGHKDSVNSVNFSPDGQIIASSSNDRTVKLWHKNGQLITTLRGHKDRVYSVSFSPDGKVLVSASGDGTLKFWTIKGNLIKTLNSHRGAVMWTSFSPDGQIIAAAGEDKIIKLWRRDGKLLKTLLGHSAKVNYVGFSPNGQIIGSTSDDRTIKLWNLSGKLLKTIPGHEGAVVGLSFSPDNQLIASSSNDNTVRLWEINNTDFSQPYKVLHGHGDTVTSVQFSPDGKTIASSSYDKTVKLWQREEESRTTLKGHTDDVIDVSFSPDGQLIASSSKDNTIKLWQRDRNGFNPHPQKSLIGHSERIDRVIFSPDGQLIVSASRDKTIKIWTRTGKLLKTLIGHKDWVLDVAFSPDGKTIASASRDKTIKLWTTSGELIKTLTEHRDRVNAVNFSSDGKLLASASDDKTVKIWTGDGKFLKTLQDHTNWVLDVAFSPNSELLASASYDNTVKLWGRASLIGTESTRPYKTLIGHTDSVAHIHFSPDGKILATTSWDKRVQLWRLDDTLIKSLEGHSDRVSNVSFSPDGRLLASASSDNTIVVWNLDLDDLLNRSCSWLDEYLKTNSKVRDSDRQLCN